MMFLTGEIQDAQRAASGAGSSPTSRQADQHPPLQLRLRTLAGLRQLGDVQEVPETPEDSNRPGHPLHRLHRGSESAAALPDHHRGAREPQEPLGWEGGHMMNSIEVLVYMNVVFSGAAELLAKVLVFLLSLTAPLNVSTS